MKTEATRKQIEAFVGEPIRLRKVSFVDLARSVSYGLNTVAPLPQMLGKDEADNARTMQRAAKIAEACQAFTYRGCKLIRG